MSPPTGRFRRVLLLALVASAAWSWAVAGAQQQAEVLYSLEIERDQLLSGEAPAPDAQTLAASLVDATAIRTYVFEPVAAVPTPRLVGMLVTADGSSVEQHALARELVFPDTYLPPGIDLVALADAIDAKAALADLLASLGAHRLRALDLAALGFAGAGEREQVAIAEATRLLRRASAHHPNRMLAALAIAAVPRTVETFDAGAGEGGAYVMLLDAGPAPGP